MANNMML